MIHAFGSAIPASLMATGMPMVRIGNSAGQRGPLGEAMVGAATLMARRRRRRSSLSARRGGGMQIGHGFDGLRKTLDVRDVVTRQFARTQEDVGDLQETEAHQVRPERNAQGDEPLRKLEVG